jgi:hypothetical protein
VAALTLRLGLAAKINKNDEKYPANTMERIMNFPGHIEPLLDGAILDSVKTDRLVDIRNKLNYFAIHQARATGIKLAGKSASEITSSNSELWVFRNSFLDLGLNVDTLNQFTVHERGLVIPLLFEELACGDAALANAMRVAMLPQYIVTKFNNHFLIERFPYSMWGCCAHAGLNGEVLSRGYQPKSITCNDSAAVVARLDKYKLIINGSTLGGICCGLVAEVCLLSCAAATRDGELIVGQGYIVMVPMDAVGVRREESSASVGYKSFLQSTIVFDGVELSLDYVLAGPQDYHHGINIMLAEKYAATAAIYAGIAKSAYELVLNYARNYQQSIGEDTGCDSLASSLFTMLRKIEMVIALTKKAGYENATLSLSALNAAVMAKVSAMQSAFDVSSEALKIFGCTEVAEKTLIEKLFRDVTSALIESGDNKSISIMAGRDIINKSFVAI